MSNVIKLQNCFYQEKNAKRQAQVVDQTIDSVAVLAHVVDV